MSTPTPYQPVGVNPPHPNQTNQRSTTTVHAHHEHVENISALNLHGPHGQVENNPHPKVFSSAAQPNITTVNLESSSYVDALKKSVHDLNKDPVIVIEEGAQPYIEYAKRKLKAASTFEGKPAIMFKKKEKEILVSKLDYVLVGKFSHGRPNINDIKEFFTNLKLKGEYNLSLFDTKHLFIECKLMEDFTRLWLRWNWFIKGFPMRLFKWSFDFSPTKESSICPVWIQLPGLPLYFYKEDELLSVANVIGRPLKIDSSNLNRVRLGEAWVCVELDTAKPLVNSFWIGFEKDEGDEGEEGEVGVEGFWQQVHYSPFPSYCSLCSHVGHGCGECKKRVNIVTDRLIEGNTKEMAKDNEKGKTVWVEQGWKKKGYLWGGKI